MLRPLKHKEAGYDYKIFGLVFHSNLSLSGIPLKGNSAGTQDLALHLGISPYAKPENRPVSEELTYVSSDTNDKGEPLLQIWNVDQGSFVRMAYEDGIQFWLDQLRENIWATWPDHLPLENMTSYLLGPVLGLLLRLRGVTCLHASAVAIEDRAVAFVGPPGAGKSTTAAACSKMGYAVLSDDISALEERDGLFYLVAAYPQLRLWPESVKLLYGRTEALPRFNPEWDKRRLGLGDPGACFENRTFPQVTAAPPPRRMWSRYGRKRLFCPWSRTLTPTKSWIGTCAPASLRFWAGWPPAFRFAGSFLLAILIGSRLSVG